jgi:mannose-6-phosphate isomerase-like protein (cupin superfamily)
MTVDDEDRAVSPGDLVYIYIIYIPPDRVHSLRPVGGGAIYCFWFVVDYMSHVCK